MYFSEESKLFRAAIHISLNTSLLLLLSRFSCVRLCATPYGSPPGSPIPGILQARTLEWVAISFSNAWKWKVKVKLLSRVWLLATHGLQPTRVLHPWDFPGKSTGVGCHYLLWNTSQKLNKKKLQCSCVVWKSASLNIKGHMHIQA